MCFHVCSLSLSLSMCSLSYVFPLSLFRALSLSLSLCSRFLMCSLSLTFMCSLSLPPSSLSFTGVQCSLTFSLSLSHTFSLSLSLYLAMLMATSSLAVLVRSRKSWLSSVGRNWTYTPVSTASSDWGTNTVYQSLHDNSPPYHSHSTMTATLLITAFQT